MRKVILVALVAFTATNAWGQKKAEIEFQVSGVCGMCEARIEKALDVPGIVAAEWDQKTQKATVAYKTNVISEDQIHQLVAAVGHDTEKYKATDEVYQNLHGCCKYREGGSCSGSDGGQKQDR